MRLSMVALLALLAVLPAAAQDCQDLKIEITRLSERVAVFTEDTPMRNNIIAFASKKGIVVVDTASSYITAAKIRKMIEKEFGRDDFIYTINTHYHWDHSRGNQVFKDTMIVGHELCVGSMKEDDAKRPFRIKDRGEYLKSEKNRLAALDPDSKEAKEMKWRLGFSLRNYRCDKEGYELTTPGIVFKDKMKLNLGDLTFNLIYFGMAHSGSDILIHVPEEGVLCTGDLFLDQGWTPLFAGLNKLDPERFIKTLSMVLDKDDSVKTVIPGHKDLWKREKLVMWRDYIVNLWDTVKRSGDKGESVSYVMKKFPLEKKYYYLSQLGHSEQAIKDFHFRTVNAFYRQIMESAAVILEDTFRKEGIDAIQNRYMKLRDSKNKGISFNEIEINNLGYKLMGEGELKAAIILFELNVKTFPSSWNVYDSLAEAYLNAGKKESAIEYYKKSLRMNPDNKNGVDILKKLEGGV